MSIVAALAGIFSIISAFFVMGVPHIGQIIWLLRKVEPQASQVCTFDWILFQVNHPIPPKINGIIVIIRNIPPAKSIKNFPAGVGKRISKINNLKFHMIKTPKIKNKNLFGDIYIDPKKLDKILRYI